MLRTLVAVQAALCTSPSRRRIRTWWLSRTAFVDRSDGGQATAEYALVLLGVAAVALLLLAWATRSGKLGQLFDAVVDDLIGKVA